VCAGCIWIIGLEYPEMGSSECKNGPSGCVKNKLFLDQVSDYHLLKINSMDNKNHRSDLNVRKENKRMKPNPLTKLKKDEK
jgi:hypothetical protein